MMDGSSQGPVQEEHCQNFYSLRRASLLTPSSYNLSRKSLATASTILHLPTIEYRPILPLDFEILRKIHEDLFPVKYETEFFLNVVNSHGIRSWAAVDKSRSGPQSDEIIGFVTTRLVSTTDIDATDMLGYDTIKTEKTLIYILTLGVITPYRNLGIASSLIHKVIEYASTIQTCRAVYLHVISYNDNAIKFYQKNRFQCLQKLRDFYFINGNHYDAYLYIYYVNGGRSPCLALDFLMAMKNYLWSIVTSISGRLFQTREANKTGRWPKSGEFGRLLSSGRCLHRNMDNLGCASV